MPGKKKSQPKKTWFGFGSPPSRTKTKRARKTTRAETIASLKKTAAVVATICGLGGAAVGFAYMERYVHAASPVTRPNGALELIAPPRWINTALQARIAQAAGGYYFTLNDETAAAVAAGLQKLAWLYNIRVRTTDSTIHVHSDYRKPLAMIRNGSRKYYVALVQPDDAIYVPDSPKVVLLDYIEMDTLPILEMKGVSTRGMPPVGGAWDAPAVTSAVELISALERMDEVSCREKPLLNELESIDLSNFDGKDKDAPHVILYARDGTPIHWGAVHGKSRLYLEATEQEKLGKLYAFYKENNYTIQCLRNRICRYIELRYSRKIFPRPE